MLEAQHALTSLQLGIWGSLEPPADPRHTPGGGPRAYISLKMRSWSIHTKLQFCEFVVESHKE